MSVFLLDTNVMIALLWARHEHHAAAQRWFQSSGKRAWATCAVTELAFVRILSNPAFSPEAVRPAQAAAVLQASLAHPGHRFWIDRWGAGALLQPFKDHLQGHRQVTDAYVLGLALRREGRLATFDRGVESLVPEPRLARLVERVPTGATA